MEPTAMTTCQHDSTMRYVSGNGVLARFKRAFSLIELLIVVAILVVLVSLIVVGLQRVQVAAARTESANALRQMIGAYHAYSGENNNRLMPGYIEFEALQAEQAKHPLLLLNVRLPSGEWMVPQQPHDDPKYVREHENMSSYVWRLAPYLSDGWQTFMTDYRDRGVMSYFEGQVGDFNQTKGAILGPGSPKYQPGGKAPTVASAPSFGLNSIFFGGDNRHGGKGVANMHPWGASADEKFAATRASEVRNARAIVFGPSGAGDRNWQSTGTIYLTNAGVNGYAELRPPFLTNAKGIWRGRQWRSGQGGRIEPVESTVYEKGAGLPIIRRSSGNMIPVAMFDGSAEVVNVTDIEVDMRRWSPFQTGMELPPVDLQ